MITDEQFSSAIKDISDVYEQIKDAVYAACPRTTDAMDINEKVARLRDVACIALRESHTTKNFNDN